MEEEDLFLKGVAEKRRSTLLGSMEDNERENEKRLKRDLRKKAVNECCKTYWLQRFPVITWIGKYNISFFISDMIAGVTVGLTAIPQGVAYAVVAGLEPQFLYSATVSGSSLSKMKPQKIKLIAVNLLIFYFIQTNILSKTLAEIRQIQYGLYSGFMGGFIYFFLGTVKEITIGPTAIMALLVRNYVEKYNTDFAVFSCFLTGCITLLLGILHLGFLVNFIALPVTVGFTTAAALTIATSQLKSLLGIPGKSTQFLPALISTFQEIRKTRFEDLGLGLFTIAFLIGMKVLNTKMFRKHRESLSLKKRTRFCLRSIRFITLGKNGIAVIIGTVTAYVLSLNGLSPFTLTGKVGHGLPKLSLPPFSTYVTVNNETVYLPFESMAKIMSTSIISIPLLSILETIAIGKIFARGNSLDATQELIALGVCNTLGSFVQSMPTAGSFTRSVINNASGVATPLAGVITGIIVLSALSLTATFEYIPKASLAAVILTAMFYMIDYHEFLLIWRVNRLDTIPLCMTIIFCLGVELDVGILVGILANFFLIVYINLKPKFTHEELTVLGEEVILFHLNQTPIYPGAEYVRNSIFKTLKLKKKAFVVIDGTHMLKTDSTTIRTFKVLAENLGKQHQEYAFWNWPPEYKKLFSRVSEEVAIHFHNTNTIEELVELVIIKDTEDKEEQEVQQG